MSGKFGDLIRKARETEQPEQETSKPESQYSALPESQNTVLTENHLTTNPDNHKTSPEITQVLEKPKDVNLTIKVPESLRRHWAAESKREGVSMTAVITQALIERFGTPEARD